MRVNKKKPATTNNDAIPRKAPDMHRRTPLSKAKEEKFLLDDEKMEKSKKH